MTKKVQRPLSVLQSQKVHIVQQLVAIIMLFFVSLNTYAQCPTGIFGGPSTTVVCSPAPSFSLSGGDATSTWNYKENGSIVSTGTGATFSTPSASGNGIIVEIELITSGCGQQSAGYTIKSANFTYITGVAWYDVEFTENNTSVSWSGPGINWNDGGNSNVFYNICTSGSGTVSMTTADGCSASQTISYTGVDPQVSGPTSVNCGGSATFTGTQNGGTGTFSVSPANAGTMSGGTFTADANFSGTATINYSVDYSYTTPKSGTNNVTCATSTTINVNCVSCNLSLSPSSTNVSCNGGSNGSASVTPSGASGSVNYAWSNGGSSSSISGLSAGVYNVTATDGAGCTATTVVTITEPSSSVSASCSSTNVTTSGGSNGTASVVASGGTPGYSYSWSNGGNSSSISGLNAGNYSVIVTDANGCTSDCNVTITEPSCSLSLSSSSTNVSCNSGSNGSASVTPSGASGSVNYAWSNGGSSSSISGLSAGVYNVTATDGVGCTAATAVTISEPSSVSASCSSTDVTTSGGSNGTASVVASGGTPGYSYSWSNGGNTSSISGLNAGNYSVIVTDANGCTSDCNVTITEPSCSLSLSSSSTNVSCNGGSNGSASVTPSGASGSVNYAWSNGGSSSSISGLSAGVYNVTATDGAGCTATAAVTISQPSSSVNASCSSTNVTTVGGSNGTASVVASGGTPGYSYSWSNGGNTSSISGLNAGNYSVIVTDANGCTSDCNVTITEPSCSLSLSSSSTNVSCNGGSNGSASVTPSGASGSVNYAWSNGGSSSSISGLSAGVYNVTATDGAGCTATAAVTISQPTSSVNASCSSTNVTTVGGSNGTASVVASGGTPSYSYSWSNGGNTSSISGLNAGNYSVIVTDANGCTSDCNVTIIEPSCSLSLLPSSTNVSCNGGSNGSASVTPSGASGSVNYTWSNGGTSSSISGLIAGVYNVTATDGAGCTATAAVTISQPSSSVNASCSSTNVTTVGGSNGTASVVASGGTPGYTYSWSNGGNTSTISGLNAGNYSVVVTDGNGCSSNCNVVITEPGCSLNLLPSSTNVLCNGGSNGSASVTPSGASGSVNYTWSNGGSSSSISGLIAGVYNVTATDGAGCTATAAVTISQPSSSVNASCSATSVTTLGGSNGTASVVASGGTPGYSYSWSNGGNTSSISGLSTGNYSVVVTDANGCSVTCMSTVNQPGCNINASVSNIVCNNMSTTSITDDRYSFDLMVTNPTSSVGNYTTNNALIGGSNYGVVNTITNQFLITSGQLAFVVSDAAVPGCNQTVVVNPPAACSQPCNLTAVVNSVTSVNSTTVGITFTIAGSNGNDWSASQKLDPNGSSALPLISGTGDGTFYTTAPALNYNTTFGSGGNGFVFWYMLHDYTDCLGDVFIPLPKICLGNYVWNDLNQDGLQNNGEVGVSGVTTTLYNANTSSILATVTTDAYGFYQFCGLTPGDYRVGFSLPANYVFTSSNTGGNDEVDSDPSNITGLTATVTLAPGDSNMTVDAGIYQPQPITASVGDRVWFDENSNGMQDLTEQGVSGITVSLYACSNLLTPISTTITDASGYYIFENVLAGSYSVGFSVPIGMVFTSQSGNVSDISNSDVNVSTERTACFNVVGGDQITYVDAGIKIKPNSSVSLGDKVWNDADHDGVQDPNETGVQGVTVTLFNESGNTVIYTTTTDGLGNYSFNGFPAGCYVIGFSLPVGYTRTTQNAGTDTSKNSDANASTGLTNQICISAGQNNPTIDAGIYNASNTNSVGDRVWYDEDKDGLQDALEYGYPGIVVTLYDCTTNAIRGTTTTNASGNYLFSGLANGDYYVGFGFVPGYRFTGANSDVAGVLGGNNSDANPSTGLTNCVSLVGNTNITAVDAGVYPGGDRTATSTLGDIVWVDANNNGLQDDGETGVPGVSVKLFDATTNTELASTFTDGLGNYIFTNLDGGLYKVEFSNLPAGYTFTTQGSNIEDESNSDADGTTGMTNAIPLGVGEDKLSVDAGILAPVGTVCLGDYVWIDLNNNGIQDSNEPAVSGVTVKLYDNNTNTVLQVATTNSEGNYLFCGLTNGNTYSVGFENLPAGFAFTTSSGILSTSTNSDANPSTGRTATVTMGATNVLTIDAGIYSATTAVVGNYVWYDEDADGIQDPTEAPISGVLVTMYDNTNTSVASAVTDANGGYLFTNVTPGTYTIGFEGYPRSLVPTTKGVTNPATADDDSNVDPNTGRTDAFTVTAGSSNLTLDAGYKANPIAGLGNYVWYDVNEDGLQGANEPAIAGIVATLYAANGTTVLASAITDGNGAYSFPNLTAGNYVVGFSNIPSGFTRTQSIGALNDALNSDITATNKSAVVELVAGTYNPNIDAGFYFGVPLPVNLESFEVYANECQTDLNWVTSMEQHVSYFDVLRKGIGSTNFVSVGHVDAIGNSQQSHSYSYRDENLQDGNYQYKLRMVDEDTKTTETAIRLATVKCKALEEINIYPNPASTKFIVSMFAAIPTDYTINMRDITGKLLKQTQVSIEGKGQVELDVQEYANGLYVVEVISFETSNTFKLQLSK